MVARLTGLEPATPGVTGRYSNQLSYNRSLLLDRPSVRGVLRTTPIPVKRFRARFFINYNPHLSKAKITVKSVDFRYSSRVCFWHSAQYSCN